MELSVKEITDKNIWEEFLKKCMEKTFLNSWNWGNFQQSLGEKVWRFAVYENNALIAVAQVIKVCSRRGTFLFVPHGPNIKCQALDIKKNVLESLLEKLKEVARQESCSFIRIAPLWQRNQKNENTFQELGFRKAALHTHPELTWQLDIAKSEDELLMAMRKTTRYLIKQGLKNPDLEIESQQNINSIAIFNKIYSTTAKRHQFVPFSIRYLENEFKAFGQDSQIMSFLAKYKGEYIAAAIVVFWQGQAFYHHGASSSKHPQIPASYLLQWRAIQEAKNRNCSIYNFWGIVDVENAQKRKRHPWHGLSLFKKGFGGYERAYVKTQDLPLSWKYWLTFIFEKIRKLKRRL